MVKKILIATLVLFLVTPWMVDFFLVPILSKSLLSETNEDQINPYQYLPAFEKDLLILGPKLAFLNIQRTKDAGPYLNPLSEWSIGPEGKSKLEVYLKKNQASKKLVLDESIKERIKNHKGNPFTFETAGLPPIDTTFLRELRAYDHWDIDKNSPLDEFPRYNLLMSPMVSYHTPYLKLHLAKVKHASEDEKVESLLDVLHYGELALTTEFLVGSMIFVSAIKMVHRSTEDQPELRVKLGPWSDLLDEADRLKRVLYGINQFARPFAGVDLLRMEQIYKKTSMTFGLCASIRESTGMDYKLWSLYLEGLTEQYTAYRKLLEEDTKDCRLTWLKSKTPPWQKLLNEEDYFSDSTIFDSKNLYGDQKTLSGSPVVTKFIRFLPNTRKLIAIIVTQVASPNYTKLYIDPPAKKDIAK